MKLKELQYFCVRTIGSFLCSTGLAGAAECRSDPFAFEFGAIVNITMIVGSGYSCSAWSRLGTKTVEMLEINSPPHHGKAQPRGATGVTYRSDPRYVGNDAFEFIVLGSTKSNSGTEIVRVNVTVK